MTWQVLCAAPSSTVPNADLSSVAAEALAIALSGVWPPHGINPQVRGATRFAFAESEATRPAHA